MIPIAAGARIWIATGRTHMRKGIHGLNLALLVQEGFGRDSFAGGVFLFRDCAGTLIKALWHHGIRLSLYAKRIEENLGARALAKKEIPLSPIAIVRRIDAPFEVKRSIDGRRSEALLQVRQALSRSLVEDLQVYMREQLAKLSRGHDVAKAFN